MLVHMQVVKKGHNFSFAAELKALIYKLWFPRVWKLIKEKRWTNPIDTGERESKRSPLFLVGAHKALANLGTKSSFSGI